MMPNVVSIRLLKAVNEVAYMIICSFYYYCVLSLIFMLYMASIKCHCSFFYYRATTRKNLLAARGLDTDVNRFSIHIA